MIVFRKISSHFEKQSVVTANEKLIQAVETIDILSDCKNNKRPSKSISFNNNVHDLPLGDMSMDGLSLGRPNEYSLCRTSSRIKQSTFQMRVALVTSQTEENCNDAGTKHYHVLALRLR